VGCDRLSCTSAHIACAEANAPELFTAGAKILGLPGDFGKVMPEALEAVLRAEGPPGKPVPKVLSLSQATEAGTVYSPHEVDALSRLAKAQGLAVHMDGARLANAIAHLGCAPAEITWRAGVDILSFGCTKNGAMAAEAVVFFDTSLARNFGHARKRGGHTLSKMRFVSAQIKAYIEHDLWLGNARQANAAASRLSHALSAILNVELLGPVQANIIFARLPPDLIQMLRTAGFSFHTSNGLVRLVTAYDMTDEAIDLFIGTTQRFGDAR
jgi:threonine aldolase